MVAHFYDTSPSGPAEQEARLRPLTSLLQAGIPFMVIAEDALSILHRVPTVLFDMQLLVPDNLVSMAARTLCANAPYRISDNAGPLWRALNFRKSKFERSYRGPSAWNSTFTVPLVHTSPQDVEAQEWPNPMHILIHPQSSFHFDVNSSSRTCLNPEPPSSDLASIRFPTLPALYDMVVDTFFDPPVDNEKVHSHLRICENYLVMYSLSDTEGALFENEPFHGTHHTFDLRHLLPNCWNALDEVKDENKLFLARSILGPRGLVESEAIRLERHLVKQISMASRGWPSTTTSCPAGMSPEKASSYLLRLQANYTAQKPTFDILYRRWPRIFRYLPKF